MKGSSKGKKGLIALVVLLVCLCVIETAREKFSYDYYTKFFEHSYWQIQKGMTQAEVARVAGQPEEVTREGAEENWYWRASNHRGPLLKLLHIASGKGYELNVAFDNENQVRDVYAGAK
ncbi:MAG: hypothetical protein WCB68_13695 [Pyrinomonadaceae bacterium]